MSKTNDWNQKVIEEFRAKGGKVGGPFENMDLLLLHTTGAKSGQPRINPVAYTRNGDGYVVIASKGGAPTHPDWYYNLVANPDITVEVGVEELQVQAQVVQEPERTRLFDRMAAVYPGFDEYRHQTERTIPVILLSPRVQE